MSLNRRHGPFCSHVSAHVGGFAHPTIIGTCSFPDVAGWVLICDQVAHLGRELLQERTRVKALSEELENPLNVHRRAPAARQLASLIG